MVRTSSLMQPHGGTPQAGMAKTVFDHLLAEAGKEGHAGILREADGAPLKARLDAAPAAIPAEAQIPSGEPDERQPGAQQTRQRDKATVVRKRGGGKHHAGVG